MSTWNIYHKDGSKLTDVNGEQITVHGLEYSDSWMGECFLTINFKHEVPINFQIGDYIVYRGERFELNYEPGKDKQARPGTYGDGFIYDSVKFNALQDELSRTEFLDVVLNDNQLHYTSLPKFQFYVETIDDLLDRIQANLNEQIGVGKWKIFSRSKSRSMQRGVTEAEWGEAYGEGTEDFSDFDSKSITIDSKTCWEALALSNSEWDINFIVRNRCVYVGTAGVTTQNIFKYGLGNGLYEIDQNADSDQSIITRLRAYGSEKNLPEHYYADLGSTPFLNITGDYNASSTENGLSVMLENSEFNGMFTNIKSDNGSNMKHVLVSCKIDDYLFDAELELVLKGGTTCTTRLLIDNDKTVSDAVKAKIDAGFKQVLFLSGAKATKFNKNRINYVQNLPNNMSINRLMLPGFPHVSLSDFYDSLTDEEKKYVNPTGKQHRFSTDPYRPYIDSVNIEQIGLRSASQFFDTDDKTNGVIEIYPTIEEMVIGGVRVDEIDEGVAPDDDGRYDGDPGPNNVDIYLSKAVDFDIKDLADDDFSISMKDGMCGGRTFKVVSSTKVDGRWRLTIERDPDDALDLWFPYRDYPIKKGDHFVLTGITLPDSYVNAASLKLLKYAIALIDKNDYTRYVYQPKVDEIFMARQHDQAQADDTGVIKSLHDTLKAGDLMEFEDTDLRIGGTISIDQLTIKEEDGKIPTYDITLREDKEVGTIQKMQQQISSLQSGNGGTGAGLTTTQVKNQVATEGSKHFISKINDDIAKGTVTWEKVQKLLSGLFLGNGNNYSIDGNGNAILSSVLVNLLKSLDFNEAEQSGFAIKQRSDGKYQMLLTDLIVWGKAIFNTLLIRELSYVGGNIVLSPAAGKISYIKEVFSDTTNELIGWKCYLLADDGTTATINSFKVDDQVRCKTFNIKAGVYENVSNKDYWRLVTKVSAENEAITDTEGHELYDGKKFAWIQIAKDNCMEGSDNPAAGDTVVLMGNRSDTSRQHLLMMETEGDSAPKFAMYRGINSYSLKDKAIFDVGFDGVSIVSKFFQLVNVSGEKIWTPIYLGDWKEGTEYSYYDEVTWMGTRWLCIVSEGQTTTAEPSEDSPYWKATTAIQRNKLLIDLRGQDTLDWGETIDVVCSVVRGDAEIDTSSGWDWSVERDSGNKQEDAAWNASSKAQSFKGTINIAFTENENDLGAENKNTFGVVFTFKAWQIGNKTNEVSATLSV
jgi:hypothetical protein